MWFWFIFFIPPIVRQNQNIVKLPFFWCLEILRLIFFIFLRMEILQLLWVSWPRGWTTLIVILFPSYRTRFCLAATCVRLLSNPRNLRIAWFNFLMAGYREDEDRRYSPWPSPLQAEQAPLLAHPGPQLSWWFSSEASPVSQHLLYTEKTQTGHSTPDMGSQALNRGVNHSPLPVGWVLLTQLNTQLKFHSWK